MAKKIVVSILGWQIRRLYKKNNFKVVAVAGSLGKTSTKFAIAKILEQKYRVRKQAGNYNDIVTVPLIFFGEELPSLLNPFAWLSIFVRNEKELGKNYPYDVVVVEVGTDGPGQIKEYKKYLRADVGVLTAIAPEHMEFFNDLDAVADEELAIVQLTDKLIVNKDFCDQKYLQQLPGQPTTYAVKHPADFQVTDVKFDGFESSFKVKKDGSVFLKASHELIAEPLLYATAAAVAVADELGLSANEILSGLKQIKPVAGRMQRLEGLNGSVILDDTYNASPPAVKAALDTLYRLETAEKIAILGNMNELGNYSETAHKEIGNYCDPKKLDLLIAIGPDAKRFLSPAAKAKGCKVVEFDDPYSAGEYLKPRLQKGTLVLAKGSQNGVFAEETVKLLLANPADAKKLVRQSDYWLKRKATVFKKSA